MNRGKSGYYAAIVLAGLLLGGCKDEQQRKEEQAALVRTSLDDMRLHAEQLLFLPGVRQIRSFIGLREVLSTTQLTF
ncbi:Leucine-responsive regulatory protein, regulator for leucine (or lrp) regulon and high-affinity branched-chain amino acid transport system [Brenneria goodwinii]|uniref:Leucine-responsive regulatory protein, regulator for leucine (Or lrp) regulon and high-affinity branched-chain amino acid transport system n=1 Tax=Brenneria goodwinii TaxID=1109412 RepID=A0A0G4JT71_9GAMM|nr:Leucine-responsive regulatory protein, regulator for leucine (or lrp) regulon and high-affinity branched-chain amino acid transport system [Brenneria goodwinii]